MTRMCIWNAVKCNAVCPGISILLELDNKLALSLGICLD